MEMMTIIVLWILLGIIAFIVALLHFSVKAYVKLDDDGFEIKAKYLWFTLYPRIKKEKRVKQKKVKPQKTKQKKARVKKESNQEFQDNIDDDFENIKTEKSVKEEKVFEQTVTENPEEKATEIKTGAKETEKITKEYEKTEASEENTSKLKELKEKYNKIKPYIPKGWKYFKKLLKAIHITDLRINIDIGREDAHEAAIYYGTIQGILFNTLGNIANIFTVKIKKADVNCIFTKNTIDGEGECYVKVRPSTLIAIAFCIAVNFGIIYFRQKRQNKAEMINDENESDNKLEVS